MLRKHVSLAAMINRLTSGDEARPLELQGEEIDGNRGEEEEGHLGGRGRTRFLGGGEF